MESLLEKYPAPARSDQMAWVGHMNSLRDMAEETVVYENGSGSFEISDDGKLLWTGAADEQCQSCVFVTIAE